MEGLDLFNTGSPFGGPAPQPTEAVKRSAFEEVQQIKIAADTVKEATRRAKASGNRKRLAYLSGLANELMVMLAEFIKKAFVLAVFKFVMELCAQIVQSLVQAMVNRNQKPVEISTPGVFFTHPGQQTPPASQQTYTQSGPRQTSFDNPFGDVFRGAGSW